MKQMEQRKVTAIGFDERIDKTKLEVWLGISGCKRFEEKKEEH